MLSCRAAVPAVAGAGNGTEPGDSQPECQQALDSLSEVGVGAHEVRERSGSGKVAAELGKHLGVDVTLERDGG